MKDGKCFFFNFLVNYDIIFVVEGLKCVCFFSKVFNGRMFVMDMYDLIDNKKGIVYILDEWNVEIGKFGKIIFYMIGLKNLNLV